MPYRGPTFAVFSPGLITTPEKRAVLFLLGQSQKGPMCAGVCVCVSLCGGRFMKLESSLSASQGFFPLLVVGRVDQIEFPTEQERVTEKSFMALSLGSQVA